MTSSARQTILSRLRERTSQPASQPPDFRVMNTRRWSLEDGIERFIAQQASVHGDVQRVHEPDLATAVLSRLHQAGAHRVLIAPSQGLRDALVTRAQNIDFQGYDQKVEAWQSELFHQTDAAITSCHAGLADTGSLVVIPSPEEPRLMTLAPPLHIAILPVSRLFSSWYQLITEEDWTGPMPTNTLLISGPSKTADIEQTLVYGAHGPKALTVFLVDGI
ncbi:LutC/YkgG family protein [Saccharospirillum impatiens]|uniref:LutC/YkgG family protein n=1 Tax=Saccharospirillum impatiens TaxID=169438 RepID=UPI00041E016D|nr:lactate utilization protein C [Saccharospirillum impatiens]